MPSNKEKPIQKPSLEIPAEPQPVEQSEELTREVFEEHKDDADPEKHRGNSQGGFKYDKGEKK